jgi:hypothetical protein
VFRPVAENESGHEAALFAAALPVGFDPFVEALAVRKWMANSP